MGNPDHSKILTHKFLLESLLLIEEMMGLQSNQILPLDMRSKFQY